MTKLILTIRRRMWFRPLQRALTTAAIFGLISEERAGRWLAKYGLVQQVIEAKDFTITLGD